MCYQELELPPCARAGLLKVSPPDTIQVVENRSENCDDEQCPKPSRHRPRRPGQEVEHWGGIGHLSIVVTPQDSYFILGSGFQRVKLNGHFVGRAVYHLPIVEAGPSLHGDA